MTITDDLARAADKAIQARRKFGDRSVQYTLALIELNRVKREQGEEVARVKATAPIPLLRSGR